MPHQAVVTGNHPNCGAPIADEAVEMVLKRMEEIYK